MIRKTAFAIFLLMGLLLSACTAPATATPQPDRPNPASVHCQEQGGKLEIRQDAAGGQHGVCVFADKSECDEWAYYRGDCKPGDSVQPTTSTPSGAAGLTNPASAYCKTHGGTVELRQDSSGGVQGMCVFPDKSECDEWAYYRDECKAGTPAP